MCEENEMNIDREIAEKVLKHRERSRKNYAANKKKILARHHVRYQEKKEEILEQQKDYLSTEKGKEVNYRKARKWAENNPEKRRAHEMVKDAIRRGDLIKQNCEGCGENKVEAHHDDYTKPLDVRWLCRRCHRDEH